MARDPQKNFPLPGSNDDRRRSANHLPAFFRTETNDRFLSSTLDQLIQPGTAEKINGYFGRKQAKQYRPNDSYIGDVSNDRENYQFEPAAVIKDSIGNVEFYRDYRDYINQINNLGGDVSDHSVLNRQEYYTWNPHMDWDKFANYREYYWLPNGPQPIAVAGDRIAQESTYRVSLQDNLDNYGYVLTPDGFTQNPELTLYRGVTYRFDIDTPGVPLSFRSNRTTAAPWTANTFYQTGETVVHEGRIYVAENTHRASDTFEQDLDKWSIDNQFNLSNEVTDQGVEQGVIEFTANNETPDYVYYVSDADISAGGLVRVYDIEEATFIDVDQDIIGKSTYRTGDGFDLSNGMKIYFQGNTAPESYQDGFYYVEGVGESIELIPESDLTLSTAFLTDEVVEFDSEGFDTVPYSRAIGFPRNKDYVLINKRARDGNLWSKYNRWFHLSVIQQSAEINQTELVLDQNQRATRPIIEFEPGLKLFDFGTQEKQPVDLIDNFTVDVFSNIEGQQGYNIDGVSLTNGMRVLFTADPDIRVNGRIFEVNFIDFKGRRQIALVEADDSEPLVDQTVLVGQGLEFQGRIFFYNGKEWQSAQQKTRENQPPLFDVFNCDGDSLSDDSVYPSTDFAGTEIFSYKQGSGPVDTELGFALAYSNIENVGDIVFNFDLLTDTATFCPSDGKIQQEPTGLGYLRQYTSRNEYNIVNGWQVTDDLSSQSVIRLYDATANQIEFPVDVYDNSGLLQDLRTKVYVNDRLQREFVDYEIIVRNNTATVAFYKIITEDNVVKIKTQSRQPKNHLGFYEIPSNLEKNPENGDITEITLGEINDHVRSIVENLDDFSGQFPGKSNLRDKGNVTAFGNNIVKHSVPMNLPLYHLLDREANIVKAMKFARAQYSKFKREFVKQAHDLPFSGNVKEHVDFILQHMFATKKNSDAFYFSDMVPHGATKTTDFDIKSDQQKFFALSRPFTLDDSSDQAVLVYKNSEQLVYGADYDFNSEGFVILKADIARGDTVTISEYENTLGSFVPQTPTKLGLYPKFVPTKTIDDTYLETRDVIVGHDGSRVFAFKDYRDNLLLELERRIYNNIKVDYNTDLFDLYDYIPGNYRNTGLSKQQLDQSLLPDFVEWLALVDQDYTENTAYDRQNPFTWNHASAADWQGNSVSGTWRQLYYDAYDTDSPHTQPWRLQGFWQKPDWWEDQYGPAPYTKDNLILWEDIEQGIIRQPGTPFRKEPRFARPAITNHLPVDAEGNLVSPVYSRFLDYYNSDRLGEDFVFGDRSPVELAWRNSSEYPFALLTALIVNQPNRVFATAFDRRRQQRDLTGQISYTEPNRQLTTQKIVFPNTVNDSERVYCSGLVNYVRDYVLSDVTDLYQNYKRRLASIENQIGFKIAGFTSREKFNLILDSRTPNNQGNVFVPQENYEVFLSKSESIENIFYSGVIVEKTASGFLVRGYADQHPYFKYFKSVPTASDSKINVGGVSSPVIDWEQDITITAGTVVQLNRDFYRATETHQTQREFDESKFVSITEVPIQGGRTAFLRSKFSNKATEIKYGEKFETVQELVDFLLGYGEYLESKGFVFDYFDSESATVTDWKTAAREFLYWTTQNWSAGSVIALSPAAFRVKFRSEFAFVDDIYDLFYGYSLRKVDGNELPAGLTALTREEPNLFEIRTKNTEDGIFGLRISLVQKEHAVLLDNKTVFGDIIFEKESGYRQERIRVLGYRSSDWDGTLNVPGFVFDDAKVTPWQPWQDYAIGDLVRYKEFVYSAKNRVAGSAEFDSSNWARLDATPERGLLPNFEYKTNQFADFYDLDSDNFDEEQQKFAQHLIGYQNRQYLANIINDDVSQYKFYQGFIQEKGSANALSKLFDALGSSNQDSLEFFEEWAIREGQYGAVKGFEEIEFLLNEKQFRTEPQTFDLVNRVPENTTDLITRITPSEVYQKPSDYDNRPFPEIYVADTFTKDAGYVHPNDAEFRLNEYNDILDLDYSNVMIGDTVWAANDAVSWNIYIHVETDLEIENIEAEDNGYRIDLATAQFDLEQDEIIGIFNCFEADGIYRIAEIVNNSVHLTAKDTQDLSQNQTQGRITRFKSVRFHNFDDVNAVVPDMEKGVDSIWVDQDAVNNWRALQRQQVFDQKQILNEDTVAGFDFGSSFDTDRRNTVLAVGSPNEGSGKVYVYGRSSTAAEFVLTNELEADTDVADSGQQFGASVALTGDGRYLLVGSPAASNVKTFYEGDYSTDRSFEIGSIVNYNGVLWQSTLDIQAANSKITFESFQSVIGILLDLGLTDQTDSQVVTLLAGNYPFTASQDVDHVLVKAPTDMYQGSQIGDTVELAWNTNSYANQSTGINTEVQPFDGTIPEITGSVLSNKFTIADKIDSVLTVEFASNLPGLGDLVEASTGTAEVAYIGQSISGSITLYLRNQNGSFGDSGELSTTTGLVVGSYVTEAPENMSTVSDRLSGYFKLNLDFEYAVGSVVNDTAKGLVFADLIPQGDSDHGYYYNILDFVTDITSSRDSVASEIVRLSYVGTPGPNGVEDSFLSDQFVMRAPAEITGAVDSSQTYNDKLSVGDTVDIFYNTAENYNSGSFVDPNTIGISVEEISATKTVQDIWDGYFDVELTEDYQDQPLEPKVGLTVRDTDFGGTAEIEYYQKFNNRDIRIFVKNVSGRWAQGDNFGEPRFIEFLADGSGDPKFDPASGSRTFGLIISRAIGLEEAGIGKLLVFAADDVISVEGQQSIQDAEYWFYQQNTVDGADREASIPGPNNNEWQRVYNIPAVSNGTESGLTEQGMYTVFESRANNRWTNLGAFTVLQAADNARLGYQIRTGENSLLQRAFVSSAGNGANQPGQIHVVKNGQENDQQYFWELGQNKKYKGVFSSDTDYSTGDVVFHEGKMLQADTNIVAGAFDSSDWQTAEPVDYLGYIPNTTGPVLSEVNTVDPENLQQFGLDFDISENGEVIVVSLQFDNEGNKIAVYRNINGLFTLDQLLDNSNSALDIEAGRSLAVSPDGEFFAAGSPLNDNQQTDQGTVFVFKQNSGKFEDSQTLIPPVSGKALLFGSNVTINADSLFVTAENGNGILETSFDSDETTFDQDQVSYRTVNYNSGSIFVYEKLDNTYLYGNTVDFDDFDVRYFGRNVHAENNLLYVGLPKWPATDTSQGAVVTYEKTDNVWQDKRIIKPTVDVSKIKKVFLYDTKKAEILEYLDYIDVRQGKIAGSAEQEINFKTYFDPAVYTVGENVQTSQTNNWNSRQAGKIWWDLTNTRFLNPYLENVNFSANSWNELFSQENTVDVYEWVESDIKPAEWDRLSETEQGFQKNITGQTKYGNAAYVAQREYSQETNSFSTKYYYWVRNRKTKPAISNRRLSAQEIADLIRDPAGQDYRFIAMVSPSQFALYNCDSLIKERDVALDIQYYTLDNQDLNVHSQYQLLSDGLSTSQPNRDIEQKWFDSLVGFDLARRPVPAPELTDKDKYGNLNRPRQSWFVNRTEALKETVDRINRILKENLIVETKDISRLTEFEHPPVEQSGKYDRTVQSEDELEFISTAGLNKAELSVTVKNGKLSSVEIVSGGLGYQNPPVVSVTGTGINGKVTVEIDNNGTVTNATITDPGENYGAGTSLQTRSYSVLVENDSELQGQWALYSIDNSGNWERVERQGYDVSRYWEYNNWYAPGYGVFTEINHLVDFSYELDIIDDSIGDTVKINNIGAGGWLLLEKVNDIKDVDYTINYKTIGRQDGTIQFSSSLYDVTESQTGFDVTLYDSLSFDAVPSTETRIILETVRDNIFTDDLRIEYNQLFFASLRYAFSEQKSIDWAFKTSFVKAKHNVGELEQRITFRNDNLPNYEDYFQEVKPYKTTIREYVSDYEALDNTQSVTTDFDLSPAFNFSTGRIEPYTVKLNNNEIEITNASLQSYPERHWLDNAGYTVTEILIGDAGFGYTAAPVITISGGGGFGATAIASIGRSGEITDVKVTNPGSGYITAPEVRVNGSQTDAGTVSRLSAKIGDSPVRTFTTGIRFDRVSNNREYYDLDTVETFVGAGSKIEYNLGWPVDLKPSNTTITVDGNELLRGKYSIENTVDESKSYKRQLGKVIFEQAPRNGSTIEVRYQKAAALLHAQDRINLLLKPDSEVDFADYMQGVDYGGVEIDSISWQITSGWDTDEWFVGSWDSFDETYEDRVFYRKSVVLQFDAELVAAAYGIEVGAEIFQDNSNAKGYVTEITDTSITVNSVMHENWTTQDIIQTDLSNNSNDSILLQNDLPAVPSDVSAHLLLDEPLELDTNFNVYVREVTNNGLLIRNTRLDDPDYNTANQTNSDAVLQTLEGDGSTVIFDLESYNIDTNQSQNNSEVSVIIRKTTSDGSKTPLQEFYDADLSGGDLAYQSATGLRAEDILIDGDGFVTPTTSAAPEETVPGQVNDTVDIQVYERPANGSSSVTSLNFITDGVRSMFDLPVSPVKKQNLFVKLNNNIVDTDEYVIDFDNQTVNFVNPPEKDSRLNMLILGYSAERILGIETFQGDGEITDFLTNTRYEDNVEAFVTVNGVEKQFEIMQSDNSYELSGNVVVRFDNAPAASAVISVMIAKADPAVTRNYSAVSVDEFVADGSTTQFTLQNNIFQQQPASAYSLVTVNDTVLSAGYSQNFEVTRSRTYTLDNNQIPSSSVPFYGVEVYLNGRKLNQPREYTFASSSAFESATQSGDTQGSTVVLKPGIGRSGDELKVFVIADSEYRFGFFDEENVEFVEQRGIDSSLPVLNLDSAYSNGDVIRVYNFANHDSQGIERHTVTVDKNREFIPESSEYYKYKKLTNGVVQLKKPAAQSQWVWVSVNGKLLDPNIDYWVSNDRMYVNLVKEPSTGDKIDVFHLAEQPTTSAFAWRQFKDMLNKTHFKKITAAYNLAEDLHWYDTEIVVKDATGLPAPAFNTREPGVIFLDGERIEYFVKSGNTLKQLRRGTLGTGVKQVYTQGTEFTEQGASATMPYKDSLQTQTLTGDGSTRQFALQYAVNSVNEIEVFVAGRRLRKNAVDMFDITEALDSPQADVQKDSEFSVDAEANRLLLNNAPTENVDITIVHKSGSVWNELGTRLATSQSDIARFLQN